MERRKKSLLIGINYTGSAHELRGCHSDIANIAAFLSSRAYPSAETDLASQVILLDSPEIDPSSSYYPTGHNMLAAMDWLVSEPNTTCFLHYSGHGGQVPDPDYAGEEGTTGIDDTIVPVDFEVNGMIDSDTLHRHLVSGLKGSSTLFIVLDCCHSGSAVELPFVYRSDEEGNVNRELVVTSVFLSLSLTSNLTYDLPTLPPPNQPTQTNEQPKPGHIVMDNLKKGAALVGEAQHLIQGGFTFDKIGEARELFAGATDFFRGLKHMAEQGEEQSGLVDDEPFVEEWGKESKFVTMFSGCRDDQTSADAMIAGENVGAMSWAFLDTMRRVPDATYLTVSFSFSFCCRWFLLFFCW